MNLLRRIWEIVRTILTPQHKDEAIAPVEGAAATALQPDLTPDDERHLGLELAHRDLRRAEWIAWGLALSLALDPGIVSLAPRLTVPANLIVALDVVVGVLAACAVALSMRDIARSLAQRMRGIFASASALIDKYWQVGVGVVVVAVVAEAITRGARGGLEALLVSLVIGAIVAYQTWRQLSTLLKNRTLRKNSRRAHVMEAARQQFIVQLAPAVLSRLACFALSAMIVARQLPHELSVVFGILGAAMIAGAFPSRADFIAGCQRCARNTAILPGEIRGTCASCAEETTPLVDTIRS